jgi:outer membrane lipoprotein
MAFVQCRFAQEYAMQTSQLTTGSITSGSRNESKLPSDALKIGMLTLPLLLALGGCASIPKPLQGNFAPLDPVAAAQRDATGESVRWGGTLAVVEPLAGQTCFQIVGRPLAGSSRPTTSDRAEGRFIACRQGFYEPQVFAQGRSVTVTGRVIGYETRRVGEYDYRQPRVAADVIYLWPERREVDVYYAPSLWWSW